MYRDALHDLKQWKESSRRKPLIIEGARQVGKTWLMQEFGAQEYRNTVYINFDHNEIMSNLFAGDLSIQRIMQGIELYCGHTITPDDTLLIFDEIQEVPAALASLKYFCENALEYHIICAGSLLGIALHQGTSFPVGKVDFLKLYPLSFREFLIADGMKDCADMIARKDFEMMKVFRLKLTDALKKYYYVGGMPEAVLSFSANHDYHQVAQIQDNILAAYDQDVSKHAPNDQVPRIRAVWNSIPSQLAKENRKFVYGLLRQGGRAKEYETAIMWLCDCGLARKVSRISAPKLPLKAYEDLKAFKLYFLDVGLLSRLSGLTPMTLLAKNALFSEFKGALTEQYVQQELTANGVQNIYYYTNERSTLEIDLILGLDASIIPIEVKAEENLRAKSLKSFQEKYECPLAIRTSMSDYRKESWLTNLPLYAVSALTGPDGIALS